jgi:hypothetical protein
VAYVRIEDKEQKSDQIHQPARLFVPAAQTEIKRNKKFTPKALASKIALKITPPNPRQLPAQPPIPKALLKAQ